MTPPLDQVDLSDDLSWRSATELRALIGSGALSPVVLLEHVLARIEALQPRLHAFAFLDTAGARAAAREAEAAVRRGETLGLLHGIPVSVKDHIAVRGQPAHGLPSVGVATMTEASTDDHFGVERLPRWRNPSRQEQHDGRRRWRSRQSQRGRAGAGGSVRGLQLGGGGTQPMGHAAGTGLVELRRSRRGRSRYSSGGDRL